MNAEKLTTPLGKARELQRTLYLSAKMSSFRRFHALYDKVYREDILYRAWREVCNNKGSAGIDKQSIEDVQRYGVEKLIVEIQEELKTNSYQPQPVKRVYIPKADGKKRPLGIPEHYHEAYSRIVQMMYPTLDKAVMGSAIRQAMPEWISSLGLMAWWKGFAIFGGAYALAYFVRKLWN